MNPATQSALFLLAAGWLQSFVYICGKLPPERIPPGYPKSGTALGLLNLAWIIMFVFGISGTLKLSPWFAVVGAILYFTALPFAVQLPLVKLFGFRNFRHFMDVVDGTEPPESAGKGD